MEEEKVTKPKKVTKAKTTSLKNKKAVKSTLAKASIKGKTTAKKTTKKASTIKKTPVVKKEVTTEKEPEILLNVVKKEEPQKRKKVVKEPNNIKRRIKKEKVEPAKEETVKQVVEKKAEEPKKTLSKREERKKLRAEKRKKRKEQKLKQKEEKRKLKEKRLKEKKEKEELKKKKIELPKEWKTINSKNNAKKEKVVEVEKPKGLKGRIFESIDEKELQEQKRKSKESFKKTVIVVLILGIIIALVLYALLRYNDFLRKQLAVYEPFRIGDKVQLEDESIWYVISDSDSKTDTVKLLSSTLADVTGDGIINENDRTRYNTKNEAEYDVNDTNSAAYYLNGVVKRRLVEKIGTIEEISLLTSKEYVKIRERMNYGDEWSTSNWLAGTSYQRWWILSEKNNKVYVATTKGTFFLTNPNNYQYIRPTIVIKKDSVTKIEDKKQLTVDLIKGLKR